MSRLSPKALDRLSEELGQLTTRYEALCRQVATLHMQGNGTVQSAYYVGVAQTIARDVRNGLDQLSNAIYNLSLHAQKADESTAANREENASGTPRQEKAERSQANTGPGLDTPRPGSGNVRDQVAAAPLDQSRTDQPVV